MSDTVSLYRQKRRIFWDADGKPDITPVEFRLVPWCETHDMSAGETECLLGNEVRWGLASASPNCAVTTKLVEV